MIYRKDDAYLYAPVQTKTDVKKKWNKKAFLQKNSERIIQKADKANPRARKLWGTKEDANLLFNELEKLNAEQKNKERLSFLIQKASEINNKIQKMDYKDAMFREFVDTFNDLLSDIYGILNKKQNKDILKNTPDKPIGDLEFLIDILNMQQLRDCNPNRFSKTNNTLKIHKNKVRSNLDKIPLNETYTIQK